VLVDRAFRLEAGVAAVAGIVIPTGIPDRV
jgi:hypothetical protein